MELEAALKASMKTFEAEDRARGGRDDEEGGMVGTVLNRAAGSGEEKKEP